MITIKAYNVIHQGRRNQNTTYWFLDQDYGYTEDTPDAIIETDLETHKPKDVELQKK